MCALATLRDARPPWARAEHAGPALDSTSHHARTPFMNRLLAGRRSTALHIALWLVPLAAVVWWGTKQQAPTFPDSATALAWLGGALLVYVVATLARGERWDRILRRSDVNVGRVDAYGITVVGYAGNNALPARGGELLRVFLMSSRTHAKRRTVLGTILAERVLDAVALALILVIVAFSLIEKLGSPTPGELIIVGIIALVVVVVALVAWFRYRHHVDRVVAALRPVIAPVKTLWSPAGVGLLALSIAIWTLEAAVYLMIGESVGIHLGLAGAMSVVAFTNLAALIPAAPGYIGTYDAAVIFATRTVTDASKSTVLSYLLLLRFTLFVPITIVGFALLFFRYGGLARLREAREAAREAARASASRPAEPGLAEVVAATAEHVATPAEPVKAAAEPVKASA